MDGGSSPRVSPSRAEARDGRHGGRAAGRAPRCPSRRCAARSRSRPRRAEPTADPRDGRHRAGALHPARWCPPRRVNYRRSGTRRTTSGCSGPTDPMMSISPGDRLPLAHDMDDIGVARRAAASVSSSRRTEPRSRPGTRWTTSRSSTRPSPMVSISPSGQPEPGIAPKHEMHDIGLQRPDRPDDVHLAGRPPASDTRDGRRRRRAPGQAPRCPSRRAGNQSRASHRSTRCTTSGYSGPTDPMMSISPDDRPPPTHETDDVGVEHPAKPQGVHLAERATRARHRTEARDARHRATAAQPTR